MKKQLLGLLLVCGGLFSAAHGQTTVPSGQSQTYTSPVAGRTGASIFDMVRLKRSDLFSFDLSKRQGGIVATMLPGAANARVSVEMYRYDPAIPTGKGWPWLKVWSKG